MTPQEFTYWLQGYFEIAAAGESNGLTESQVEVIRDHLKLVFAKVTPDRATPNHPPLAEPAPIAIPVPSVPPSTNPFADPYPWAKPIETWCSHGTDLWSMPIC